MKNFTPLIFLIACLFFQTTSLVAQTDGCGDFDFTLKAKGVFCGSQRGGIEVNIAGGSGQYLIEWDSKDSRIWNEANTFLSFYHIVDLLPGDYEIKVMDTKTRCAIRKEVTLVSNALPENLEITPSPVTCEGVGILAVRIPTQNPPFNINVRGPITASYLANSNNFRIYNLPAGTYEIDFLIGECTATATATIENGVGLPQLSVSAIMGSCGISTGAVTVDITGGKPGYTLKWEGPTTGEIKLEASAEIPDFVSGTYQFTIIDAAGCKSFQTITVDRSGMSVALTPSQSKCNQNGTIKVDITGGVAPYTVSWRNGTIEGSRVVEGTSTILSLPAGTYVVEIKDVNGCSTFASASIIQEPTDLYCSITPTNTTCGLNNGSINVFISGGTKPYSLSYDGPESGIAIVDGSTIFTDLPAGTYTTFLQDADGCAVSESSTIEVGPSENATSSFTFSATGTSVFFFNNSTTGSYAWTFGDGTSSTDVSPTKEYNSPGVYEVCLTTTGKCDSNTQCQNVTATALRNISGQGLQTINIEQEVGVQSGESNEESLRVAQNYPNPFVNQTDILFELPVAFLTTITIHDNTGKVIQQHTANYGKGSNLFTFNQNALAAGVYYYTIKAGTFSETKKMLVE